MTTIVGHYQKIRFSAFQRQMKVQIRSRNQVTIPEKVLKAMGLKPGDDLLMEVKDGNLTLIPAVSIPRDEAYLFTPEWQGALREAEGELREGEYEVFHSFEDLMKDLDSDEHHPARTF